MLQGETNSEKVNRCMDIPCERQKQNAPGFGDPRAFALPREIGVTDLREGNQSMMGTALFDRCISTHKNSTAPRSIRDRNGVAGLAIANDMRSFIVE
jgi:hypothetical protein